MDVAAQFASYLTKSCLRVDKIINVSLHGCSLNWLHEFRKKIIEVNLYFID